MDSEHVKKLLIYSLSESLRDPVNLLTPHLEFIFDLPSIILQSPHEVSSSLSCCRCDVPSHALPVGHFYSGVEDAVLSFSVPRNVRFRDYRPDAFEMHIPARFLLNHDLAPPGTRTDVTAPPVPLHMWGDKVCVNLRTRMLDASLNGLPSTFAGRSVMFKTRQRPWPPQRPHSSSSTAPDVATIMVGQEPSTVNVLAMADHHPRRVARALARNDAHITFGLTLKPPFSVDDMVAEEIEAGRRERSARRGENQAPYIRTEAVLPDELQGRFDDEHSFYAAMCGDAVVVFQASTACSPVSGMD